MTERFAPPLCCPTCGHNLHTRVVTPEDRALVLAVTVLAALGAWTFVWRRLM